jgi:hypothetical protein
VKDQVSNLEDHLATVVKEAIDGNTTSLCETIRGYVESSSNDTKRAIACALRITGGHLEDQLDAEEACDIVGEPTDVHSTEASQPTRPYVLPSPMDTTRAASATPLLNIVEPGHFTLSPKYDCLMDILDHQCFGTGKFHDEHGGIKGPNTAFGKHWRKGTADGWLSQWALIST